MKRLKSVIQKRTFKVSLIIGLIGAVAVGFIPAMGEWFEARRPKPVSPTVAEIRTLPTPTATPTPVGPTSDLSIEKVMSWTYGEESEIESVSDHTRLRKVSLGGDVMLGRAVGFNITRLKDVGYPFAEIGEELKQSDATIVNLENPIVADCPLRTDGMVFCSSPLTVKTLLSGGVDMVSLANNHSLNYGLDGLTQTQQYLEIEEIEHAGLGLPGVVDVRGMTVGLLAFTQLSDGGVLAKADAETVMSQVEEWRDTVDVLFVSFHWGAEYQDHPTVGQRLLAMKALDSGADVVFGHHPHWIQGMEIYDGKPIFYSLGNLVFDQMWSRETREGLVVDLAFWDDQLVEITLKPVFMEDFAQPTWMVRGRGNVVLDKIDRLNQELERTQAEVVRLGGS